MCKACQILSGHICSPSARPSDQTRCRDTWVKRGVAIDSSAQQLLCFECGEFTSDTYSRVKYAFQLKNVKMTPSSGTPSSSEQPNNFSLTNPCNDDLQTTESFQFASQDRGRKPVQEGQHDNSTQEQGFWDGTHCGLAKRPLHWPLNHRAD